MINKIIILIPLLSVLISCERLENFFTKTNPYKRLRKLSEVEPLIITKPLVIDGSNISFKSILEDAPSYVSISGVWKLISDQTYEELYKCFCLFDTNPHSVKIYCDKTNGFCNVLEVELIEYNGVYYIDYYQFIYFIKSWDNNKIIARKYNSLDNCFSYILEIDLNSQEVLSKTIINSNKNCSSFKGINTPIIYKLVDKDQSMYDYSISLTKKIKK